MNRDICDEVLENIKYSLLHCQNNKQTYELHGPFAINKCDNISTYASSLHATNTKIIFKTNPIIPSNINEELNNKRNQ
jgi:hypothetical protein